jgi:hypothetical protein
MCEQMRWAPLVTVGDGWQRADIRAGRQVCVVHVWSGVGSVLVGDRWGSLVLAGYRWQVTWSLAPS